MKYRKKPVVIEAVQYNGKNGNELKCWSGNVIIESPVLEPSKDNPSGEYVQIKTLEGVMTGIVGDWIIKEADCEYYPCKPYIFQKIYEPVDESSTSAEEEDAVNIVDWIRDNNFRKRYVGNECKWQVGTHLYSTLELYRLFKNKPTTPDSLPSSSVTGDSEEVERRTRIIEKLVKDDSMYHVHVQDSYKEQRWKLFKREHKL